MASIAAHDNQCGIDLARPPSTAGATAVRVFDVPLVRATADSLRGFGRIVSDFRTAGCDITPFPLSGWRRAVPGTGDEGGCVEDLFRTERHGLVQYSTNVGLARTYVIGFYGRDPSVAAASESVTPTDGEIFESILTHEANYHADGGQVIASRDGAAFVLLLARSGDDVTPSAFRAFLVDPQADPSVVGIHIDAGTWHQPAFPAIGTGGASPPPDATLDNRQGKVHSCVGCSFIHEFGGYLRVPLSARALVDAATLPPPPSPAQVRLGYAIHYVHDVLKTLTFYETAFGLKRRLLTPDYTYGELETGATALAFASRTLASASTGQPEFASSAHGCPPAPFEVGLVVPDVDAALTRALAAGALLVAPVKKKPWGQSVAYVRDEDGLLVALCSAMA